MSVWKRSRRWFWWWNLHNTSINLFIGIIFDESYFHDFYDSST